MNSSYNYDLKYKYISYNISVKIQKYFHKIYERRIQSFINLKIRILFLKFRLRFKFSMNQIKI